MLVDDLLLLWGLGGVLRVLQIQGWRQEGSGSWESQNDDRHQNEQEPILFHVNCNVSGLDSIRLPTFSSTPQVASRLMHPPHTPSGRVLDDPDFASPHGLQTQRRPRRHRNANPGRRYDQSPVGRTTRFIGTGSGRVGSGRTSKSRAQPTPKGSRHSESILPPSLPPPSSTTSSWGTRDD